MSPFTSELRAARAAQLSWSRHLIRERLPPVRALRALLVERTDEITAAIHADIARPAIEVTGSELLPTAAALKFLEQRAARVLAPQTISSRLRPTWLMGCRDAVHRRPWGTVGIIGTWNYPLFLNAVQIAQALVAGNAVLWKPSENVPRTADLTLALFRDAGFPRDLVQQLPATREAGPQLAEADVDYLVFTGSDAVGRKLATKLGERLVPSTLELSGCDAMFVLADANLDLAVRAAWFGATLNRGQTCIAVRRIFVQRVRYSEFVVKMRAFVANSAPVSLVTEGQRTQAERLIADAVGRGATALRRDPSPQPPPPRGEGEKDKAPPSLSGKGDGGLGSSFLPTLLTDVHPAALICSDACFAPVAAVVPFDTLDDIEPLARRSAFGLGASIFTADTEKARELAARIPAGSVSINDVLAPTAHPATPFGGRGASGWGVTQGTEGLLAMTVPQVVTVRRGTFRPHFDEALSPDPATADILRGLLRWTHARSLREKLRGLWQMIRGVRKKK